MSEATPVVSIRASNRKELDLARKERRFRATTFQRVGIEQHISKNYTPEALHEMAVKLRKKKNVDKEFLTQLSQALAENRQNATVFMGVDGVLQALCSFLTGNDASLQLEATYCLVNAALSEDETKNTSAIGSTTGAYLMTLIGSGSPSLQEACCWAISNLLPQSKTLMSVLDFIGNMVKLLSSPFENVRSAAIQCLVQFIRTCSPEPDDLVKISMHVKMVIQSGTCNATSFAWLLFLLSCHDCCDEHVFESSLITWCFTRLSSEKTPNFESTLIDLLNSPYEPIRKETFLWVANLINSSGPLVLSEALKSALNAVANLFGK